MCCTVYIYSVVVFFQAEDGIRDLVRSRGLGDVYKRQRLTRELDEMVVASRVSEGEPATEVDVESMVRTLVCLLYTSDAADERSSVDLGGRRIIKKKI